MKLSKFHDVHQLMITRQDLRSKIDYAMEGTYDNSGLGITIRGQYQNDEMINACRQAVVAELEKRLRAVDRELTLLGVIVEE